MIWRSTYQSKAVQLVDFLTAVGCFPVTYYFAIYLHTLIPSIFPSNLEIRSSDIFIIFIISVLIVFLFEKQKAYSYQRFTSLIREYAIERFYKFKKDFTAKTRSRKMFILKCFLHAFVSSWRKKLNFWNCPIVIKVCFTGSLISIAVLFLFGFFVVSFLLFIPEKSFLFYAASLITDVTHRSTFYEKMDVDKNNRTRERSHPFGR